MERQKITGIIGPPACGGKSTLLQGFNRMNDFVPHAMSPANCFWIIRISTEKCRPVEVRRKIGMVFQNPTPSPKSIYENIAWGARINGFKGKMDELVEQSLRSAALWDEVKDKPATKRFIPLWRSTAAIVHCPHHCHSTRNYFDGRTRLSARPDLDPARIEDHEELKKNYTILIVTHNMQQAARASDFTAMMIDDQRAGGVIESTTPKPFTRPKDKRTEDYVTEDLDNESCLSLTVCLSAQIGSFSTLQIGFRGADHRRCNCQGSKMNITNPSRIYDLKTFESDIQQVKGRSVLLGSMVEHAIIGLGGCKKKRDIKAAERSFAEDKEINKKRFAIENQLMILIATQQPMAHDLRLFASTMEIISELERMGDHTPKALPTSMSAWAMKTALPLIDVPRMGTKGADMSTAPLTAFVQEDVATACPAHRG